MSAINDLINDLEAADGPNRWIDAKIDALFRVGTTKMRGPGYEWAWSNFPVWAHHKQAQGMCGVQHDNGDLGLVWDSMEFTRSLDAAFYLAAKALDLSAIDIEVSFRTISGAPAHGRSFINSPDVEVGARAKTPALSLCLAILKAAQAQTAQEEKAA